jgi:hypothetical protein
MNNDYITIVSGLPRTGTSMMMKMLDAGGIPALIDNIRTADEDNPKGYYEFEPVKKTKEDASWLNQAPGKVVKMVHLLLLDLPTEREYRVVFMKRNIEEVVASQNVMLQRHGKDTDSLPEERLIEVFEAQLLKVGVYLKEHPNFKVLELNYNEVLADPVPAVQALNDFLGGSLNTEAMIHVVDPSLYRQRKQ